MFESEGIGVREVRQNEEVDLQWKVEEGRCGYGRGGRGTGI